MQKFPLHLPHKVFLARSPRLPPLAVPGWSHRSRLVDLLISSKCLQAFPIHFSPSPRSLARWLSPCPVSSMNHFVSCGILSIFLFPFRCCVFVCVVIADISCSAVAAASIRHASTFVSLIASVCISIKPFSCPHMHSYMYQYVGQPLISHLSWRFINSRLKINWNFIHLIILFTRSRFALFMSQYCGIHLNCMWL